MKESESEKGIQHLNTNWILALLLIKFTAFDPRFHVLAKPMMAPIWPISIFNSHWLFWSSKSRVPASVYFNFLFGWTRGSYFTALNKSILIGRFSASCETIRWYFLFLNHVIKTKKYESFCWVKKLSSFINVIKVKKILIWQCRQIFCAEFIQVLAKKVRD